GLGLAFDGAGQRVAAQGAEANGAHLRLLAFLQREALVIDHQYQAVALYGRPRRREVERDDRDLLKMDVLPDVELGPVADWKDPDRLALGFLGVVQPPKLRPLILRIPAMIGGAEREHALLGAAFLLVAPRAAECRIEMVQIERLLQSFGFPQVG